GVADFGQGNLVADRFVGDHAADQDQHGDDQENLAGGDPAARPPFAMRHGALVELHEAPKDQDERPPVAEHLADAESSVVVKQKEGANGDQYDAAEDSAGAWTPVGHGRLLPLTLIRR